MLLPVSFLSLVIASKSSLHLLSVVVPHIDALIQFVVITSPLAGLKRPAGIQHLAEISKFILVTLLPSTLLLFALRHRLLGLTNGRLTDTFDDLKFKGNTYSRAAFSTLQSLQKRLPTMYAIVRGIRETRYAKNR